MTARLAAILILLLALPAMAQTAAPDTPPPSPASLKADMPADIVAYITRQEDCLRWSGEDPSNPQRAQKIQQAMTDLQCDKLFDDGDKLRAAHHDNANILSRLDQIDEYYSVTE